MVARVHERCDALCRNPERSDFVTLAVQVLPRFEGELLEALADKREKPPVTETLEEGVGLERFTVDAHDYSDAKGGWQVFDKL